jgi:hypothetical protein
MEMLNFEPKTRPNARKVLDKIKKILEEFKQEQENLDFKYGQQMKQAYEEEEKLRKFDESFLLSNFIYNKKFVPLLKKFLKEEHSSENIEFIEEVEKFKTIKSDEKRFQRSKEIFAIYIKHGAPQELNLNSTIRKLFYQELESYKNENKSPTNMYDAIVDEVIICMVDGFYRFQLTEDYKELYSQAKRRSSTNSLSNFLSSILN